MTKKPLCYIFSLTYPPYLGGAEVFVKELTSRMKDQQIFHVFTARYSRTVPTHENQAGVVIHRVGIGHPQIDKILFPAFAVLSAWRQSRNVMPDILHGIMASYGGFAAYLFSFLCKRPLFITEQSGNLHSDIKKRPVAFFWYRRMYERATLIHAISTAIRQDILRNVPNAAPINVIPNGVDLERFRNSDQEPPDPLSIICVARLSWEKGVEDVVRAFAILKTAFPAAKLSLVGDGPEAGKLHDLSRKLGVQQDVRFLGSVAHDTIPDLLQKSSLFVCASHYEGLGNVFIEAQASGVPVIGTDVGGIPDIVEDGVTGRLVPVRQPERLAGAMQELLAHPETARKLAVTALTKIERFSWTKVVQDVANMYRDLFEGHMPLCMVVASGIFPPDVGGPSTYTPRLAKEMQRQGMHVRVVTYGDASDANDARRTYGIVRVSRKHGVAVRYLLYVSALFRAVRNADFVFSQDPTSCGLPSLVVNWFSRKPYFVKIVGDAAWEFAQNQRMTNETIDAFQTHTRRPWIVSLLHGVQAAVCKHARGVIVPSQYLKGIVTGWGVGSHRIDVMLNAVDVPVFSPKEDDGRHDFSHLVSVGRLVEWKGFLSLVDCVHVLRKEFPSLTLSIIGDGPLREELQKRIANYKLEGAVVLAGRLTHEATVQAIRDADIFVLNTGYEGLSHVILETVATWTPLVTTVAGGNTEVVRDGSQASLVPVNDTKALTEAIRALLRNPELARERARAATEVLRRFSWTVLSELIATYFSSHVASRNTRRSS